ncbi:hypothetical protein BH11MYX3_BH11MYX3_09470 [soil metagenome]
MSDEEMRAQFRDGRCHHVVVAGFLTPEAATDLRAQIDAAPFTTFDIPDRGHYEHNRELALPALFDELRAVAEQVTERSLRIEHARWLRLRHRDYQLIKDDATDRPVPGAHVELILDVSTLTSGQAELVYTDGHESWVVPQVAGAISIVEREPWLFRYARYLNLGIGDAVIHRLRLSLSPVGPPAPAATG